MSNKSYKWRGGGNQVDFDEDYGVVRKEFHGGKVSHQSMRDRRFSSFRQAKSAAGMANLGSDQSTHVAVQRAYLRRKS